MERIEDQEKIEQHIIFSKGIVENFKKNHLFKSILETVNNLKKKESHFMEYKIQEQTVRRDIENDREFPLENECG